MATDAARIADTAIEQSGRLDIVINNAGTANHRPFERMTHGDFAAQVEVHPLGGVGLCRAACPHLKRSGTGRVINTISSGIYGCPGELDPGLSVALGSVLQDKT